MKTAGVSVSLEPKGSAPVVKSTLKGQSYVALTHLRWKDNKEKEHWEWRWAVACDSCEYACELTLLNWTINAFEAADRHDLLFHSGPDQKEDDLCVCAAQRILHVVYTKPSSSCENGFTLWLCKGCGQKSLDGWTYHQACKHAHKWADRDDSDYESCSCNATCCELCGQDYTEYLEDLLQQQPGEFNRWRR